MPCLTDSGWNLTVPDVIVQVECPLRNAQDNRMVYDMLWSDPAVADPVLAHGRFKLVPYFVFLRDSHQAPLPAVVD
jgi:hypothetical protein